MKTIACVSLYTLLLVCSHFCILMLSMGANADDNPVDELLAVTAINHQLAALPVHIKKNTDGKAGPAIRAALQESFRTENLRNSIRWALAERLSVEDTDTILQWLETPNGHAVAAGQARAIRQLSAEGSRTDVVALLNDSDRLQMLYALDEATGASANRTRLMLAVYKAMLTGLRQDTPAGEPLSQSTISQAMTDIQPEVHRQSRMATLVMLAVACQSLSNDALRDYIAFARSDAASRFFSITNNAMNRAISNASHRFALQTAAIQTAQAQPDSTLLAVQ